ncbi:MAG: sugar transferase [Rhizobiaceae bacterium]|nr:sugar transferase [Rhizobiaceae bacterium]
MLVSVPVVLAAMAVVRLTSPGPAIFAQPRVGRGGNVFVCRKLRTMRLGTPSVPTHEASASQITGVGRFLRASKLDELPQFWNVLVGEMSLVGPRPCLPTQARLIAEREKRGVMRALPGITGLAQVNGVDMSDPVACAEMDAEYLRTRSLRLDLTILFRTLVGRR